jgi:hypothetical protein
MDRSEAETLDAEGRQPLYGAGLIVTIFFEYGC